MFVVNFNRFSIAIYCTLVLCQKKVIHASYDTLIHIFNLACQILPWLLCWDVLKVHKKVFHSWSFLMKWHTRISSWEPWDQTSNSCAWIYNWNKLKSWLDFGDLDHIFKITGELKFEKVSLKLIDLLNLWLDFHWTCTDTFTKTNLHFEDLDTSLWLDSHWTCTDIPLQRLVYILVTLTPFSR